MLKLTIGETAYDVTDQWCDISLRNFGELCKIEAPDALKELWVTSVDEKKYSKAFDAISRKDRLKTFPAFFGKVVGILSTIPENVIDQLESGLREQLYYEYLHAIFLSTIVSSPQYKIGGKIEPFQPKAKKEFEFNGRVFRLPSERRIFGNTIPMKDEPIVTFAEASDIMIALEEWGEKGIEAMAAVIATYCREIVDGNVIAYSEECTLKNTELFQDLDMENTWRVFFCIMNAAGQSKNIMKAFSKEMETQIVTHRRAVV